MVFLCPSAIQEDPAMNLSNPHQCWYAPARPLYEKIRERHSSPSQTGLPDFLKENLKVVEYSKVAEFSANHKQECLFSKQLISVLITSASMREAKLRPIPIKGLEFKLGLPDLSLNDAFDLRLPENLQGLEFSGYDFFERERLLGFGLHATRADPEAVESGQCRTLHIFCLAWKPDEMCYATKGYGEFVLPETSLLMLPNSVVRPQVNTSRVSLEFIKQKQRIFAIYRPCATRLPCIIAYTLSRGTFVRVWGNSNLTPGLLVFREHAFTLYAEHERSQERILYLGTFLGYEQNKTSYLLSPIKFVGC